MKPTPCPSRLKELIALANLEPDSETRKHLKAIAQTFRDRRQKRNQEDFLYLESRFEIRIDLKSGAVEGVFDDFANALAQTESESHPDRIRECPICSEIFWAGRSDKEACDRHAARWRKQEQRRRGKIEEARKAKRRAQRVKSQTNKPFKLSKTTATILDAIALEQKRHFNTIDDYCYMHLRARTRYSGTYKTVNVTRGLKKLEEMGFINCFRPDDGDEPVKPYYTPTPKLEQLRKRLLGGTKFMYLRSWFVDKEKGQG